MPVRLLNPVATIFLVFVAWLFLPSVAAAAVNRTIDDSFGDSLTGQRVSYLPSTDTWDDETCGTKCLLQPDVSRAFKGTYTAATYDRNSVPTIITMQFTGVAIYVFFILANNAGEHTATFTAVNFTLDRTSPQLFQHTPNATTNAFEYNQLVYSQENLDNIDHTLVISTSGDTQTYVNFDYAIYTFEDDATPTTSTSSTPSGAVIYINSTATPVNATLSNDPANSTTSSISAATTSTSELGQSRGNSKAHVPAGVLVGGVIGGLSIVAFVIFIIHRNHLIPTAEERFFPHSAAKSRFKGGQHVGSISPFILHATSTSSPSRADVKSRMPFLSTPRSAGPLVITSASGDPLPIDSGRDQALSVHQEQTGPNDNERNVEEVHVPEIVMEQLNTMREQIAYLQAQLRSELPQSMSADGPPSY